MHASRSRLLPLLVVTGAMVASSVLGPQGHAAALPPSGGKIPWGAPGSCRTDGVPDDAAGPSAVLASPLDTTNCQGDVLDDSPFAEPIVRDHRDAAYGALSTPSMRPLGGGPGYGRVMPRRGELVRTGAELRAALLRAAQTSSSTIYIDDGAEINLSYCASRPTSSGCTDERSHPPQCSDYTLVVPANTTLASGRGRGASRGGIVFSRTFAECPLFAVRGPGVRITGLRIHGPDSTIENDDRIHCDGESTGIDVTSDGPARWETEIDNVELSAWPRAAIATDGVQGVRVHHNVIQFNRRHEHNGTCGSHAYGLGYGVVVGPGSVAIQANVFDHNRHDIAADGQPGEFYTASYNLVLDGAVEHSFDVHGGTDRHDCTNVAGSAFVIHHNTFLQAHKPAVRLRGIPMRGAWIYKNETRDGDAGDAFNQINAQGNFTSADNRTSVNRFPGWSVSFSGVSFWQWQRFDPTPPGALAAGDFDGDGAADVIRATSTGWQWSRSAREEWKSLNTLSEQIPRVQIGNFVGDARSDVIQATGSEWQVSEAGTSAWRSLYTTRAPLSAAALGDFEGDGHTDAFFADGSQWSIVQSFSPRVTRHYSQPYRLSELQFGNFVGDSKADVVRSTGSEWLVWDHTSNTWNHLGFSSIPLSQLTFADFNGDGFTDIARSAHGRWYISYRGASSWRPLNTSDQDLRSLLIADLNGDHHADVLSRQSPDA